MSDSAPIASICALVSGVEPAELTLESNIYTIGRSAICQIVVSRNVISRLHARIERDQLRYLISDAGSANGTFINGERIHSLRQLKDRDQIGLGAPEPLLRFIDPDPTFVPLGRLVYNEQTMSFRFDDHPLDLSIDQHRLLLHLYRNIGNLCAREVCAQALWGRDYDPGRDASALDRAMSKLRQKLRRIDPAVELIGTRRGLGYVLNA